MTHYYLYIKSGVQLNADTRFYKVRIGDSRVGLKQKTWLEAYAVEHGHFFVRWSLDAVEFAEKCRASIGDDAQLIWAVDGKTLIDNLKTGCDDPQIWQAIQHRHKLLMKIDPHYYTYYQLSKR